MKSAPIVRAPGPQWLLLLALFLAHCSAAPGQSQTSATYTVTFVSTWSAQTHPSGFPGNPHFSGLVGAVHDGSVSLWTSGALASAGIEQMAETGGKSALLSEVDALPGSAASESLSGGGISQSPGQTGISVTVTDAHPLVSLVSMLAPSPDWFVGVSGLDLRDGAGWLAQHSVDLVLWDAGTDDGATYTASNADSDPAAPISQITHAPFDASNVVGRFEFSLLSVTAVEPLPQGGKGFEVYPNPAQGSIAIRRTSPDGNELHFQLVDLLGRVVRSTWSPDREVRLGTSGLTPGMYFVRAGDSSVGAVRAVHVLR